MFDTDECKPEATGVRCTWCFANIVFDRVNTDRVRCGQNWLPSAAVHPRYCGAEDMGPNGAWQWIGARQQEEASSQSQDP